MNFYDGLTFPAAGVIPFGHHRAHTPLYYGIQFNSYGTLRVRINRGREYTLTGPACFITHPGAFFEYSLAPDERHDFSFCCFTGPRVQEYLRSGLLDLTPMPVAISREHKFAETLRELHRQRELGNYPESVNLLESLLIQLRRQTQTAAFLYQTPRLQELVHELRAHPELDWDFEKEAGRLSISTQHFRRIFRRHTGDSPQHYLIQLRLAQAANRLAHSESPVGVIAAEVGFEDVFYFSHLFRKYYGIPPKKYREEFLV